MRPLTIVAMLLLAVPLSGHSDSKSLIESGRQQLDAGNAEAAVETMKRALEAVGDSKSVAATAHFYLGLAYDTLRDSANAKEEIARLSDAAIDAYSRSIDEEPSAAAMNNLAQIRLAKGEPEKALALLRTAVALNDRQKDYYEENLGDLLLQMGRAADATKQYLRASAGRPSASRLNEKITTALVKFAEADDLSPASSARAAREYVASLYASNQIDAATRTALDLISRSERLDAQAGHELMALAAAALSKRNYEATTFAATPPAMQLVEISKKRRVSGSGAKQLLALYLSPKPDKDFSFWRATQSPSRDIPSPLEAFRLVARAIGFQKQQDGNIEAAESYYRAALGLRDYEVDSRAFLDLASLYYTTRRRGDLERVAEEFDSRLYRGKGLAYQRLDWEGVYEYHRSLGTVYTWLEQWANPSRPFASAIYQLEHAEKAVEEINRRSPRSKTIDPILDVYLADAYSATNQPERAFRARLDAAEGFVKAKDYTSGQEVLLALSEKGPKEYLTKYNPRYEQLLLAARVEKPRAVPPAFDRLDEKTWLADFTIGSELGADGTMVAGRTGDDFSPGQPIYISIEVGDAPPAATVKVIWYGPGETKIGEQERAVVAGPKHLAFAITDTLGWKKGDYRLEAWLDGKKVDTLQFSIID